MTTAHEEPVRLNECIDQWRSHEPSRNWAIRHAIIKMGVDVGEKDSPNANVELLDRVLARVRAEAAQGSKWKQQSWRCETGMCFAGWAAHEAGARWAVEPEPGEWDEQYLRGDFVNVITPDGRNMPVWQFAEEALGLGEWDSHALFEPVNDLDDLEAIVTNIKDKAGKA